MITSPTVARRAHDALATALSHPSSYGDKRGENVNRRDLQESVVELLADLFHLIKREGWDVTEIVRVAAMHQCDEQEAEEGEEVEA